MLLPKFRTAEILYDEVLKHPKGFWIGKVDPDANMSELATKDGKINLYIADLEDFAMSAYEDDIEYPDLLGRIMSLGIRRARKRYRTTG